MLATVKMDGHNINFNNFNAKLAPQLKESTPEIQDFVRLKESYQSVVIKNPENSSALLSEKNFMLQILLFLRCFTFKLKEGNAPEILNKPFALCNFERVQAKKYFEEEKDPVGKALLYEGKHLFEIPRCSRKSYFQFTFNFDL